MRASWRSISGSAAFLSAEIEVAFLSFCAINYLILEDKVIFVSTYCIL